MKLTIPDGNYHRITEIATRLQMSKVAVRKRADKLHIKPLVVPGLYNVVLYTDEQMNQIIGLGKKRG